MTSATENRSPASAPVPDVELDAVVLGAGVAGLYQLHQLREQGLRVRAIDKAGRRRRHLVLEPLPGRPLRQRGLHLPVPLRRGAVQGLELEREVPRPARDRALAALRRRPARPAQGHPVRHRASPAPTSTRTAAAGRSGPTPATSIDTQFFVSCAGMLSAPMEDLFEGQDSFRGQIVHTSRGRRSGVDLAGKRVGVVGIGATGIQVIQTIADRGRPPDRVRPHPAVRRCR